jgi:hypothetical protein
MMPSVPVVAAAAAAAAAAARSSVVAFALVAGHTLVLVPALAADMLAVAEKQGDLVLIAVVAFAAAAVDVVDQLVMELGTGFVIAAVAGTAAAVAAVVQGRHCTALQQLVVEPIDAPMA